MRKLVQTVQKHSETVREFAARLEALSYKTIASEFLGDRVAEQNRLDLLKGAFLFGLRPELRRLVLQLNGKSYKEIKEQALLEEDNMLQNMAAAAENQVLLNYTDTEAGETNPQLAQLEKITHLLSKLSSRIDSLEVKALAQNTAANKPLLCTYCSRQGHTIEDCRQRQRNTRPSYTRILCSFCNKQGHTYEQCRIRQRATQQRSGNTYNANRIYQNNPFMQTRTTNHSQNTGTIPKRVFTNYRDENPLN